MKLVEVYCSFSAAAAHLCLFRNDRIDFGELVLVLARRFDGRIEMRQTSVRGEASRFRGIDTCGLVLCCSSFMSDIRPVTIKQARTLGLPVEDPRLLGLCGRLKCCLLFEAMDQQGNASRCQGLITTSRVLQTSMRPS